MKRGPVSESEIARNRKARKSVRKPREKVRKMKIREYARERARSWKLSPGGGR